MTHPTQSASLLSPAVHVAAIAKLAQLRAAREARAALLAELSDSPHTSPMARTLGADLFALGVSLSRIECENVTRFSPSVRSAHAEANVIYQHIPDAEELADHDRRDRFDCGNG